MRVGKMSSVRSANEVEHTYENFSFGAVHDRKNTLKRLFGCSRYKIYENLCRGCGYGIFEAHGEYCNFCQCILSGRMPQQQVAVTDESEDVYENICGLHETLCESVNSDAEHSQQDEFETAKTKKTETLKRRDKKGIFQGIVDALWRERDHVQSATRVKRLDIVHNVDTIYHTQETFDLRRMCQLKQSQQAQHKKADKQIYGSVKRAQSTESFASGGSPLPTTSCERRPCDTLPRPLAFHYQSQGVCYAANNYNRNIYKYGNNDNNAKKLSLQHLQIADSVCHWMMSLRFGLLADNDEVILCDPKSIPPKNAMLFMHYSQQGAGCNGVSDRPSAVDVMTNPRSMVCDIAPAGLQQPLSNCFCAYENKSQSRHEAFLKKRHANDCSEFVTLERQNSKQNSKLNFCEHRHCLRENVEKQEDFKWQMKLIDRNASSASDVNVRMGKAATYPKWRSNKCQQPSNNACEFSGALTQSASTTNNKILGPPPLSANIAGAQHVSKQLSSRAITTSVESIECSDLNESNSEIEGAPSNFVAVGGGTGGAKRNAYFEYLRECTNISTNETISEGNKREKPDYIDGSATSVPSSNHPQTTRSESDTALICQLNGRGGRHTKSNDLEPYFDLIQDLLLSVSLNCVIIFYEQSLSIFLRCIVYRNALRPVSSSSKCTKLRKLNRRYEQFQAFYCCCIRRQVLNQQQQYPQHSKHTGEKSDASATRALVERARSRENSASGLLMSITDHCKHKPLAVNDPSDCSSTLTATTSNTEELLVIATDTSNLELVPNIEDCSEKICSLSDEKMNQRMPMPKPNTAETTKTAPTHTKRVDPLHKPETGEKLKSVSAEKSPSAAAYAAVTKEDKQRYRNTAAFELEEDTENIYQPIWEFKTVGRSQVSSDDENNDDTVSLAPSILISDDHYAWVTDDDFTYSKPPIDTSDTSTIISTSSYYSLDSSLAVAVPILRVASLKHPVLRSIGVFFSLTKPKLRAIIYDYDRVDASAYFARREEGDTPDPVTCDTCIQLSGTDTSTISPSYGSCNNNDVKSTTIGESVDVNCQRPSDIRHTTTTTQAVLASVVAWQSMLFTVDYMEDEEDLIVLEAGILRAQKFVEEFVTAPLQPFHATLKKFKSVSSENLGKTPGEDDKKTIAEKLLNRFHRGVLKLNQNVRSPKSEKKNRRMEVSSFYAQECKMYGTTLSELEFNCLAEPNVPRFVIDCIRCIEQQDCITQEGIYRASGNKVLIDDLKQKLILKAKFDLKLLQSQDIHTLTGLLKMFFRELSEPLVPQAAYNSLGTPASDTQTLLRFRHAFQSMCEPNLSTLRFLFQHLNKVAANSDANRMPASNLAIVWGPCIFAANQIHFDISGMNRLARILIEHFEFIFADNERLVD